METNLANELKKYYEVKKNGRKVFRSGKTLNQLAAEMYERLGYREVDASVLSRVITGERSFSSKQLEIFCEVAELTDRERWDIQYALYQDFCLKHDLFDFSISPDVLQIAADYPKRIYQVGMQGKPMVALGMALFASEWLRGITRKDSPSTLYQELLKIHAEVLHQLSMVYQEFTLRHEVVGITKPVIDEIREIAKKLDNEELFGIADLSLGVSYYLAGNNNAAIRLLTQALENLKNPTHKLRTNRALASSYTNLGEKGSFKISEHNGKQIISEGYASEDRVCEALEGFGRSRAKLGLPKALETLEEAQQVHNNIEAKEKAPFLAVELIRSRLEVIRCLMPEEKNLLETDGNRGIELARNNGYKRYELIIQELLDSSLNSTSRRVS